MKDEKLTSPTGVFLVEGRKLVPVNEKAPATENYVSGSMGAYEENAGYTHGQLHTVMPFTSNKVTAIMFRKWSKVPAMVIMKDKATPISYAEIESEIASIDWNFEWRQLKFEEENFNR